MRCAVCGTENVEGARFCMKCGRTLAAPPSPMAAPPPPVVAQPPPAVAPFAPTIVTPEPEPAYKPPRKPRSGLTIAVIVVAVVVVLAIAAAAVVLLLRPWQKVVTVVASPTPQIEVVTVVVTPEAPQAPETASPTVAIRPTEAPPPTPAPEPTAATAPTQPAGKAIRFIYAEGGSPQAGKELWLAYYDEARGEWDSSSAVTGADGAAVFAVPEGPAGESATFVFALSAGDLINAVEGVKGGTRMGLRLPPGSGLSGLTLQIDENLMMTVTEGTIQFWVP